MDLKELNAGTIYKCKLSQKEMLVVEIEKAVEKPTGEKLDTGAPKVEVTYDKVKAGKYVDMQGDIPMFKVDELYNGQLEELN